MKIQISNPLLRSFFEQLRFASKEQEQKIIFAAEKLMKLINPDKEYPYDFVVFRLTGTRPKADLLNRLLPGRQLLDDLRIWLNQITSQIALPVSQLSEKVSTIEEVAGRFSVSTKTIRRWQKRGLMGRIYLFPNGKKRLGFSASSIEQFQASHGQLLENAKHFRLLTQGEKNGIIDAFRQLAHKHPDWSRNRIIGQMIYQTGRVRETIRYVLSDYEQQNPQQTLGTPKKQRLNSKDAVSLYKLYRQGVKTGELIKRFGKSRPAIHKCVTQLWAKELLLRRMEYVPSLEFESQEAEKNILGSLDMQLNDNPKGKILNRQHELSLFRGYNYLKYLAHTLQMKITDLRPTIKTLKKLEMFTLQIDKLKKFLIEVNMPLVAGIAGKHVTAGVTLSELVSEGAISLMRAVEKFDYTRGYRFSTYATWVIAKDFARGAGEQAARPELFTSSDFSNFSQDERSDLLANAGALEKAQNDLRNVIETTLDERERYVVLNHFALDAGVIKKKPKTLKQIGDELGLTKERVRQIELQAIQKLRHSLSPEQFDLLTG